MGWGQKLCQVHVCSTVRFSIVLFLKSSTKIYTHNNDKSSHLSRVTAFPTPLYVQVARTQNSLRIRCRLSRVFAGRTVGRQISKNRHADSEES